MYKLQLPLRRHQQKKTYRSQLLRTSDEIKFAETRGSSDIRG
jgi:hypothetical protein